MAVTDRRVPVEAGVALRVRRWPGALAPPFLLVHGVSSNALLWDEVAARLSAAGHPADAVDLRSHGESDSPPDGYDTGTASADLAAVIEAFALPAVVAVGQSWGGNVVVRLAADRPDLVAGLVLVDGGWIDLPSQFDNWEECEAMLRPPSLSGMRAEMLRTYLRGQHPDWSDTAVNATVANLRELPDGSLERRMSIDKHMSIVRSMWDDPPARLFGKIHVPVLLLPSVSSGSETRERKRATVAAAAAALPRATVKEYVDADHDLHAQHPGELAADLLQFTQAIP